MYDFAVITTIETTLEATTVPPTAELTTERPVVSTGKDGVLTSLP